MAVTTVNSPSLTYEQVLSVLIQPLMKRATFLAAGPQVIYSATGNPISIPKLTGSTEPNWYTEAEVISPDEVTFGSVKLLDNTPSLKSLVPMSNEVIRAAVIPIEAAVRDRLVMSQALKIDDAFFRGDGLNDTPTGMVNWSGITEIDLGGTAELTFDDLLDAVGAAQGAYAQPNAVFMSPARRTFLAKIKDGMERYQLSLSPADPTRTTIAGLPIYITPHVGDDIVVADMSQVVVVHDRVEVRILDQTFGDSDVTAIRVVGRWDVAPRNAEGVVVVTGAAPIV